MRKFSTIAVIAWLFASPAVAQSCGALFVDETASVSVASAIVGPREVSQQAFAIEVQNDGDEPCETQIRITRLEGTAIPKPLSYSIRSGAAVLDIQASAGAPINSQGNLLVPQVPNSARPFPVNFMLTIPTDWGVGSGDYREQLQLQLLDQAGQLLDSLLLNLDVQIPPAVEMRVVGAAGSGAVAAVDLGEISSRDASVSDPLVIRVLSTSPYMLTVQSDNLGRMRHTNGKDMIPYQLEMDGRPVDLTAVSDFNFPDPTGATGKVYDLKFRAGPVRALAGDYQDRVTVTVNAV